MVRRRDVGVGMLGLVAGWFAACGGDDGGGGQADASTGSPSSSSGSVTATVSGTTPTSSTTEPTGTTASQLPEVDPEVAWPTLDCDALDPNYCAFPFPSNVYTVADPSLPTGRRVQFGPTPGPVSRAGVQMDLEIMQRGDGFSTSSALITLMPGATAEGLPSPLTIEASLADDSPTIILNADTGERVAHFSEIDLSHVVDGRRVLFLRPVVPLAEGTRYIAAIRDVRDADSAVLPASAAFAELRDHVATEDPDVEIRRGLYADIFQRLQSAGIERPSLQLAWDFTTASRETITGPMVHMRDDALEVVGSSGPGYTITSVDEDYSPEILRRIRGTMSVPLYLTAPETGNGFMLGDDGLPTQNGFADYPFVVLVPRSALEEPAPIVHVGHGLLGTQSQVQAGNYQRLANDYNLVLIATDWSGMSNDDLPNLLDFISAGELQRFHTVADRLHQGVLNAVLAIRMLQGDLSMDPALDMGEHSAVDPSRVHYMGSSQGGIMGAVLMAVSPDIQRGILDVPGQPYNLLLNRSVDFESYVNLLYATYEDPVDIQFGLALIQMMWDRAEPAGYSHLLRDETLPGSPAKEVLLQVAIGDHQVSTLGAHIMARAIGAPNVGPVNREVFAVQEVRGDVEGAAMIEYEFGVPEPLINVPPTEGEDPHGQLRQLDASQETRGVFLQTGVIRTNCDGPCDPE